MEKNQESYALDISQEARAAQTFVKVLDNGLRIFRPGNRRGDQFYNRLSYKRVNGKWRVKK